MAVVVLIDAYCTCWDIDARAEGKSAGPVAQIIFDACLVLYSLELAMSFLVFGWVLSKDWVVPWTNHSIAVPLPPLLLTWFSAFIPVLIVYV